MSATDPEAPSTLGDQLLRLVHWFFIAWLVGGTLYASYQVFVVLAPAGRIGPLFGGANDVPVELLLARRLYGIEGWLSFGALVVYVGVTEVLPRKLRAVLRD